MGRGNCVLGQGPPSGQEGRSPAQGWFSSASRSSPELVLLPCGCLVGMGRLSQLRVQLLLQHRTATSPPHEGLPWPRSPVLAPRILLSGSQQLMSGGEGGGECFFG